MSYYPPPAPGGPGSYGVPPAPPPNHLVWAILTTIFCCLPLGVVSIVFASQVNSKWQMGDAAGAHDASNKAKQFAIWAAILGAVAVVVYVILFAAGVMELSQL